MKKKQKSKPDLSPFDCRTLPQLCSEKSIVAGVDEVGRGSLFGPVVAASVAITVSSIEELKVIGVKDSKLLSHKRRVEFSQKIKELAIDWQIGLVDNRKIDEINIFQASLLAMGEAVNKLQPSPSVCLVDGKYPLKIIKMPQYNLTKGDLRSPIIAAASIVAKVWRDELIIKYAEEYPNYDLASNKGYGTKKHLDALSKYGASPMHRFSFRPCRGE